MIEFSKGNLHDIDHLMRVWAYAKMIGELEGIDPETQFILEVAAVTHDIACPLCREKYGNTNGKLQEEEGIPLVRVFLADTGLFVTLAFREKSFTENVIYSKLLSDKLGANLGYIYENLTAQMLRSAGNELFYYTFPAENKHNYEIDFLLSHGNKLCPIEVKSSGYKTHKSLDVFCEKFSSRVGERYLIYTKDFVKDGETTCLPPYMTPFL